VKRCGRCQQEKTLDQFYKTIGKREHGRVKGRVYYSSYCKNCQKAHTLANPKKVLTSRVTATGRRLESIRVADRKYQRRRRAAHPEWKAKEVRGYYERFPEKKAAHLAFHQAVKVGRVKRKPCKICGLANAQGHHPDYSKPLEVVWLCPSHHKLVHLGRVNIA
jgi:hypothetical protein